MTAAGGGAVVEGAASVAGVDGTGAGAGLTALLSCLAGGVASVGAVAAGAPSVRPPGTDDVMIGSEVGAAPGTGCDVFCARAGSAAAKASVETRHRAARRMAEGLSSGSGMGRAQADTRCGSAYAAITYARMTASSSHRKPNESFSPECAICLADLPLSVVTLPMPETSATRGLRTNNADRAFSVPDRAVSVSENFAALSGGWVAHGGDCPEHGARLASAP